MSLPTLGFIGAGAIVRAMVGGFCERAADTPYPIIVYDINPEASKALADKYPDRVTAVTEAQECLDKSEWVIVAILPDAGESFLKSVKFREDHKFINVMFDKTVEQCAQWMNVTPKTMLHMIPGTYLSFYPGPIVQSPPTPEAAEIFGHIGEIVAVDKRYHAAVFATVTALFAPIYALMDHIIDWAKTEGVPEEAATKYVTNMFAAVTQESISKDKAGVHHMATVSTPGGINMQALDILNENGGFTKWAETMIPIMERVGEGIPK